MTTVTFVGEDYRGLLDVLVEVCEVTRRENSRPSVIVNGKIYTDLLKVAELLPEEPLQTHHQSVVDGVFVKKQEGYRRTAQNLAHRANQIANSFARVTALAASNAQMKF